MNFLVNNFLKSPTFFSTYELPQVQSNCRLYIHERLYKDMVIKKFLTEHPYFCISCSYSNVSNRVFFKIRPCLETTLYQLMGNIDSNEEEKSDLGPYLNIHFPYFSKIPHADQLIGSLYLVTDLKTPYILIEIKY